MPDKYSITQAQLKAEVSYDTETGRFTAIRESGRRKVGAILGTYGGSGEKKTRYIRACMYEYTEQVLAWFYVYGEFPKRKLAHKDGDYLNNRIDNLVEHADEIVLNHMDDLTQVQVRNLFDYDADTGILAHKEYRHGRTKGDVAGCQNVFNRYWYVSVSGFSYRAHRLIWLYVYGMWPSLMIDHINGDRSDNRIINLREATYADQAQNRTPLEGKTSKCQGVTYYSLPQKWVATIYKDYERIHLGYFPTEDEAAEAYRVAKAKYHTFNPVQRA
jgi:hypothetical protein